MTWKLHPDGALNSETGELATALWGDDLALAHQFLLAREVADEAEQDRIKTQAILCAHIEAMGERVPGTGEMSKPKYVFVPESDAVLQRVEPANRHTDLDAVKLHLKTAELTLPQWRQLALAANNGYSRDKLKGKRWEPLVAILDKYTTNGWKEPYLLVTPVKEAGPQIRIDGVEE